MRFKTALLAAAALLCASATAQAAVIPTLTSVTDNSGDFTFSYEGTLSGDAGLTVGSRLVIFDFVGYVPGSVFSPYADVAASTELTSLGLLTVPGELDDPTLSNLVFTYTGAPFNASSGPFGQVNFSGLSARSIYGGLGADIFAALTTKNNPDGTPGGTGTPIFDTGYITVPAPAPIPEPATWAMMIIGFGGVGALLRSHRRREALLTA